MRRSRTTRYSHIRWNILEQDRAHPGNHMRTDLAELMDDGKTAEYGVVIHQHMSCQLGIIGKDGVVADMAVVCHMHIGHDPVIVPNTGNPAILHGAQIECAEFTYGVVIPY